MRRAGPEAASFDYGGQTASASAQDAPPGVGLDLTAGGAIGRFVYALVPMGFAMWLAHYAFHFLTGALTIVPVVQSFLTDTVLYRGPIRWELGALVPMSWLFPIEAVLLYLGAFAAIIAAVQIGVDIAESVARSETGHRKVIKSAAQQGLALRMALPWIVLVLLLLGFGMWIMLQPMEMRGTILMITGGA